MDGEQLIILGRLPICSPLSEADRQFGWTIWEAMIPSLKTAHSRSLLISLSFTSGKGEKIDKSFQQGAALDIEKYQYSPPCVSELSYYIVAS